MKPIVFITVDTEEDEWGAYASRTPGVANITQLPRFQQLCERYGAIPTYLCNWPVIATDNARDIVRDLASSDRAEIGTHIHPWNTPPLSEQAGPRTSMLCNLPDQLISEKLTRLHELMQGRLQFTPRTFRAGRWGFGAAVARVLEELGYTVDSSISPYIDWGSEYGPDFRGAPVAPYRFHAAAPLVPAPDGALVELPATIGFLGGNPALGQKLREWAFRPLPKRLRMVGILDRLRLASLRWLSPEVATGNELRRLASVLTEAGASYLNFTFHSPTLTPGLTPFVRTRADLAEFIARIEEFLEFARASGYRFAALGQAPQLLGLH